METSGKDKFPEEKRNGDNNMNYESVNTPAEWRVACSDPMSMSTASYLPEHPMSMCPSSFEQALWHDPPSVHSAGFGPFNIPTNIATTNVMGIGNGNLGPFSGNVDRNLEMGWNQPNLLHKGGLLLPNANVFLPPSMVQFPADSGFIERAARFSCFSGGNINDMMNQQHLGIHESIGVLPQVSGTLQGLQGIQMGSVAKLAHGHGELHKNGAAAIKAACNEEAKVDIPPGSSNMSDDTRSSGGNCRNETRGGEARSGDNSSKGFDGNKRKRNGKESEADQARGALRSSEEVDNNGDKEQKEEQNPNSPNKANGGKQGKQTSELPKEGYIHMRARRGQATNSHSLAERVRREKISERMKFLQDLVPGCNKVTGKAIMLDEIINYVQSLQRQVEFLSMKLSTVNPQLDFPIEGLLAKELRSGPSSAPPFPQTVSMGAYPPLPHLSQPGFIPPAISAMGTPSDVLRRTMSSPLSPMNGSGFKRPETNEWEGDLQNVVHMSYETSCPPENQEAAESLPSDNMKVEH